MIKSGKEDWLKKYTKLVRKHHVDQKNVALLNRQLQRLMIHHTHIKLNMVNHRDKFFNKLKIMENLRKEISKFRRKYKSMLTTEKKKQLQKMQAELPVYTLSDRVRLMELETELPKCQKFYKNNKWLQLCTSRDIKRLFDTVQYNEHALHHLRHKIMMVISDIHDLHSTINNVKKTPADKFKIRPYVQRMKWMEPTAQHTEVKATIAMVNRKRRLLTLINVRPMYILKNISQLMPHMYQYLDNK